MDMIILVAIIAFVILTWSRIGLIESQRKFEMDQYRQIRIRTEHDPDNDAALEALGDWLIDHRRYSEAISAFMAALAAHNRHRFDATCESRVNYKVRQAQREIENIIALRKNRFSLQSLGPQSKDGIVCNRCGTVNYVRAYTCDHCNELLPAATMTQSSRNLWTHVPTRNRMIESFAVLMIIIFLACIVSTFNDLIKGSIVGAVIIVLGYRFLKSIDGDVSTY